MTWLLTFFLFLFFVATWRGGYFKRTRRAPVAFRMGLFLVFVATGRGSPGVQYFLHPHTSTSTFFLSHVGAIYVATEPASVPSHFIQENNTGSPATNGREHRAQHLETGHGGGRSSQSVDRSRHPRAWRQWRRRRVIAGQRACGSGSRPAFLLSSQEPPIPH